VEEMSAGEDNQFLGCSPKGKHVLLYQQFLSLLTLRVIDFLQLAAVKSRRISQLKFLASGGASSRYIFMPGFY
jgi:hypothetical protein